MKCFTFILALVLAAPIFGAAIELEVPAAKPPAIRWNAKEKRLSASIDSLPLRTVMSKLGAATGWKIYFDPEADRPVNVAFNNRNSAEGLRQLLGSLSFAIVPQKDGASKLYVYRTTLAEATELVENDKQNRGKDWLPTEMILSLAKGSKQDIDALAKELGAKIIGRNDKLGAYRLQFDSEEAADAAREKLASNNDLRVDDNFALRNPEDFNYPGSRPASPFNLTPDTAPDGSQTVVAVIDTPVQPLDEARSKFLLPGIDVTGEVNGVVPKGTTPMHGTSMVETLLNSLNEFSGDTTKSPVRVLPVNVYRLDPAASAAAGSPQYGATSTYEVALGVYEAVKNGATIVNLSLGGDGQSPLLDDLIRQADQRGVTFFAAAGNTPTTAPTFPAANPYVFAVTASDQSGGIAPYANRGSFIDLIAPGTSFIDYGNMRYRISGTSPATAYISGIAATARASGQSPQITRAQLMQMFGLKR